MRSLARRESPCSESVRATLRETPFTPCREQCPAQRYKTQLRIMTDNNFDPAQFREQVTRAREELEQALNKQRNPAPVKPHSMPAKAPRRALLDGPFIVFNKP